MYRRRASVIIAVVGLLVCQTLAGWGSVCSMAQTSCPERKSCCCSDEQPARDSSCGLRCCHEDSAPAAPTLTAASDSTSVVWCGAFGEPLSYTAPAYPRLASESFLRWPAPPRLALPPRAPPGV